MEFKRSLRCAAFLLAIVGVCSVSYGAKPSTEHRVLQSEYWDATVDAAGYGDEFYWGESPYHPHESHELLSGEWAAAIYYDGIDTGDSSMWLTDKFIEPYWETNSDFECDTAPTRSDDP